jgi:hypothetical protein
MRLLRWPIPIHVHFELPAFVRKLMVRPIQPLIATSVRVRQIVDREEGEPDSLVTVLEFNDERTNLDDPDHVDLIQLRSSLNENGTFFIWTCSCGAPGCAGRFEGVQVSHSDGMTTWHDLDTKRKYVIRSDDLRQAFDQAILDGRLLLSNSIGLDVTPEHNSNAFQNDG